MRRPFFLRNFSHSLPIIACADELRLPLRVDYMRRPLEKKIISLISAFLISCASFSAHAGAIDIINSAVAWWNSHTTIDDGVRAQSLPNNAAASSSTGTSSAETPTSTSQSTTVTPQTGMCQVPQPIEVIRCEIGAEFLCVDTPKGGVASDYVEIRGTIDRKGGVLASLQIAVQNEYSKRLWRVDLSNSRSDGCWDGDGSTGAFCLDSQGRFSAHVSLPEYGPYVVSVTASQLEGNIVRKNVRLSRVKQLQFDESRLTLDPDVRTTQTADPAQVRVGVSLLGDCQFCDFIGASTGGVSVTVENTIRDATGSERRISCTTSIEQGGQGQFTIGVPALPGQNNLKISVCNDAVAGFCPEIKGISFVRSGGGITFETIKPAPQPSYDMSIYPVVDWQFKVGGYSGCVKMNFNREGPREICPDSVGVYSSELKPKIGINIATITAGGESFAWTFGWGNIVSPFVDGKIAPVGIEGAAGFTLSAKSAKGLVLPLISNFLASDEFKKFLEDIFGGKDDDAVKAATASGQSVSSSNGGVVIPKCVLKTDKSPLTYRLRGAPKIGSIKVDRFEFGDGQIDMTVVLKDTVIGLDIAPDENFDGLADATPLPFVVNFRAAALDISLISKRDDSGEPLIMLSSAHDDCEFKKGYYCKHKPSPLTLQNIIGGANGWGGFFKCDERAALDEDARDACGHINSLNDQTGAVTESVLDAINDALYCKGSSVLTSMARGKMKLGPVKLGCDASVTSCTGLSSLISATSIPLGVSLKKGIEISRNGLTMDVGILAGDESSFGTITKGLMIPSVGIIRGANNAAALDRSFAAGYGESIALSLDAIDAILFAAIAQGDGVKGQGLLDIDIDERGLAAMGLDLVEKCDKANPDLSKGESLPSYCIIRPRLFELLGPTLSSYGYFNQKQPLMISLRGNRALPPRVAIVNGDELPITVREAIMPGASSGAAENSSSDLSGSLVALEIGGLSISFYALEIDGSKAPDPFGNLPVLMDADGRSKIHSMRPDDPDPMKGQIITFDLSMLIGIEIGDMVQDPDDAEKNIITLKLLYDRSRIALTPMAGTNSTTAPSSGLASSLEEKLNVAIAAMATDASAIKIPIPKSLALTRAEDDGSLLSSLGLKELSFDEEGLGIKFDRDRNALQLRTNAIIKQLLHFNSEEKEFTLPADAGK